MIQLSIYSNDNITKLPPPAIVSPHLQALKIDKLIKPILIPHIYMATRQYDIHLVNEIQDQYQVQIDHNPQHDIILAVDFNKNALHK